jgi:hypothetical protein
LEDECSVGSVFQAGGWTDFLAPNKDIKCRAAKITFAERNEHYNKHQEITIEYDGIPCHDYPSVIISLPRDVPLGQGNITWLCDNGEKDHCQVISIVAMSTSAHAAPVATEFAVVQDCPNGAAYTTEESADSPGG